MIIIAIIKIYKFDNGAEVRIDNASGEKLSEGEKARRIENAIDTVEKIRAENEEKRGKEKA